MEEQSSDIASGVYRDRDEDSIGAGDQVLMKRMWRAESLSCPSQGMPINCWSRLVSASQTALLQDNHPIYYHMIAALLNI